MKVRAEMGSSVFCLGQVAQRLQSHWFGAELGHDVYFVFLCSSSIDVVNSASSSSSFFFLNGDFRGGVGWGKAKAKARRMSG